MASTTTPATSTSTTLPPTTTTTQATTTTTLGDEEVVDRFVEYLSDPAFTARLEFDIEVSSGDFALSGSGHGEIEGEASHTVIEFPGEPAEESIHLAGRTYARTGEGPWVVDMAAADPFAEPSADSTPLADLQLVAVLKTIGELEHQGTFQEDGLTFHRIGLPDGVDADPVAFGFGPDEGVGLRVSFSATSNGLPHQMLLAFDMLAEAEVPITVDSVWRFVEIGVPVSIEAPQAVWLSYISADAGYSIAHPESWEIEEIREGGGYTIDRFYGLEGEALNVVISEIDPPDQVTLNAWLDVFRSAIEADGGEVGEAESSEVGGFPARRMAFTASDALGRYPGLYLVTQIDPGEVYEFVVVGSERVDPVSLLDDFLTTFEPAD